jgi:hypothetical protein
MPIEASWTQKFVDHGKLPEISGKNRDTGKLSFGERKVWLWAQGAQPGRDGGGQQPGLCHHYPREGPLAHPTAALTGKRGKMPYSRELGSTRQAAVLTSGQVRGQ